MNAIEKLRSIGTFKPEFSKPYKGFSLLSVGFHKIECFRIVKNKFANKDSGEQDKTYLVELENEAIFLPKYFMNALGEDDIDDLSSGDEVNFL